MGMEAISRKAPEAAPAFTIGVKPLGIEDWFEIGSDLAHYLGEKHRLEAIHGDALFMAEPETEAAQREVLDLAATYLPERYPHFYKKSAAGIAIGPGETEVATGQSALPPLRRAAHLVPDDLVLMRRGDDGWRIAAASLCFPSSWSLAEKFGRPLHEVHAPVPGFGGGTRNAQLIARMFDNLKVELPVWRQNWSLYGDDDLHHPKSKSGQTDIPGQYGDALFLRRERQTLRKLPASGDIVFTIAIHIDPVEHVAAMQGGANTLAEVAAQLAEMSDEQLAYKGMSGRRDTVLQRLRCLAAG
jgi:hypothetical protein